MGIWGERLNGKSVQDFLDEQHTSSTATGMRRVLKSAIVDEVYYGAVEDIKPDGSREVFAVICPTYDDEEDDDEDMILYKFMSECDGPVYPACPLDILALLTETTDEYAVEWRERCKAFAAGTLPDVGEDGLYSEDMLN